jgi:hypothetical protein
MGAKATKRSTCTRAPAAAPASASSCASSRKSARPGRQAWFQAKQAAVSELAHVTLARG